MKRTLVSYNFVKKEEEKYNGDGVDAFHIFETKKQKNNSEKLAGRNMWAYI